MNRVLSLAALTVLAVACTRDSTTSPVGGPVEPDVPATVFIHDPGQLTDGDEVALHAEVKSRMGRPLPDVSVQWVSSAPDIALVSASGRLIALREGTVNIMAVVPGTADAVQAYRTVRVLWHPAASMELSASELALHLGGEPAGATATVRGMDGRVLLNRTVEWTSADTTIARVSDAGVILPVRAGVTQVTARHGTVSASVVVRVTAPPTQYVYAVTHVNGHRLPAVVDEYLDQRPGGAMRVLTKLHQGMYRITDGYAIQLSLVTYERVEFYGGWFDREVGRTVITDAGEVTYDWITGDAILRSTRIGGLTHTLNVVDGVPVLSFRVPGGDEVWALRLQRE
jgi:hypothetical protein